MTAGLREAIGLTTLIVFVILCFSIFLQAGRFYPIVDKFLGFAVESPVTMAPISVALTSASPSTVKARPPSY